MRNAILFLALMSASCVTKTRTRVVEPDPCHLPEKPVIPSVEIGVCTADGVQYVCLPGPSAAALGAWIEASQAWMEAAAACPGVDANLVLTS